MHAALGRHYDFLTDEVRPPPVGPMAKALVEMNDKRSAPLLASRLVDPATSTEDVRDAAEALVTLGDASVAPTLRQFFAMTRATADSEELASAALHAAEGLLKFGTAADKAVIEAAGKRIR